MLSWYNEDTLSPFYLEYGSFLNYSLHGSAIGNNGMKTLQESLLRHPGIVNLDLSDCQIGDDSIDYICQLLPGDKTRHGAYNKEIDSALISLYNKQQKFRLVQIASICRKRNKLSTCQMTILHQDSVGCLTQCILWFSQYCYDFLSTILLRKYFNPFPNTPF